MRVSNETFKSIKFFDVGAFVWFARIIMWEFPSFSVDFCFDALFLIGSTLFIGVSFSLLISIRLLDLNYIIYNFVTFFNG